MLVAYKRIARPLDEHGVATPDLYLARLRKHIAAVRRTRPSPHVVLPAPHDGDPALVAPRVRQGRWLILCPCGDAPSYDPDWQLAVCLNCAAVYRDVAPPEGWRDIEAVLMARPELATRNYEPHETVAGLRLENAVHGLKERF